MSDQIAKTKQHIAEMPYNATAWWGDKEYGFVGFELQALADSHTRLEKALEFFGIEMTEDGPLFKPSMMEKFRKSQNDKEFLALQEQVERLTAALESIKVYTFGHGHDGKSADLCAACTAHDIAKQALASGKER